MVERVESYAIDSVDVKDESLVAWKVDREEISTVAYYVVLYVVAMVALIAVHPAALWF